MSGRFPIHLSRTGLIWAALVVIGCKRSPNVEDRTLTVHALPACPVAVHAYGLFFGAGDFQPTTLNSTSDGHFLDDLGAELGLLPETKSLSVDLFSAGDSQWKGLVDVPSSGPVDVLAWPVGATCALPLVLPERATFGAFDPAHLLVVSLSQPSVVVDLTTGGVTALSASQDVLSNRARATITPFGSDALVAGGDGDPRTGEVFVRATGAFDGAPINLGVERLDHGAVVLASGETLLVGGTTNNGLGPTVGSLAIISPETRRARSLGLATLAVPRRSPTVLRLASGEILVAGGLDGSDKPVSTLEWFTPDATSRIKTVDIASGHEGGFVALPAGGALAVVAPDMPGPKNVYLITGDMAVQDATPVTGTLTKVRLFQGTNGSPLLWTGDRWMRWDAWNGKFTPFVEAHGASAPGDAIVSPDSGLALWINGASSAIEGLRFSTRGAFATDPSPLIRDTTSIAPDRLAGPDSVTFAAAEGFTLTHASIFVTDATYASFTLDVDAPSGHLPIVIVRDATGARFEVGGGLCPLPGSGSHLTVERNAARVTVTVDALPPVVCETHLPADARLSIGLSGGISGPSAVAQNLKIVRR